MCRIIVRILRNKSKIGDINKIIRKRKENDSEHHRGSLWTELEHDIRNDLSVEPLEKKVWRYRLSEMRVV